MGQKRLDERPLAVARAYAYAREMEGYGYSVEVRVEVRPESFYGDGEIMLPATVMAWVTAKDEYMGVWGDSFSAGWRSSKPTKGFSATTRFVGGTRYRTLGPSKRYASEREFGYATSVDSYRASEPEKYGIRPEADRISAPEWSAEDWDAVTDES